MNFATRLPLTAIAASKYCALRRKHLSANNGSSLLQRPSHLGFNNTSTAPLVRVR
jgi:hypothetical protein